MGLFLQVVLAVPEVYAVQLPAEYIDAMRAFAFIHVDWQAGIAPAACLGDFSTRIVFAGTAPLILLALVLLAGMIAAAASSAGRYLPQRIPWRNGVQPMEYASDQLMLTDQEAGPASPWPTQGRDLAVARPPWRKIASKGALLALPTVLFCCFMLVPSVARQVFSSFRYRTYCVYTSIDCRALVVTKVLALVTASTTATTLSHVLSTVAIRSSMTTPPPPTGTICTPTTRSGAPVAGTQATLTRRSRPTPISL
jgi:hypothetical protein